MKNIFSCRKLDHVQAGLSSGVVFCLIAVLFLTPVSAQTRPEIAEGEFNGPNSDNFLVNSYINESGSNQLTWGGTSRNSSATLPFNSQRRDYCMRIRVTGNKSESFPSQGETCRDLVGSTTQRTDTEQGRVTIQPRALMVDSWDREEEINTTAEAWRSIKGTYWSTIAFTQPAALPALQTTVMASQSQAQTYLLSLLAQERLDANSKLSHDSFRARMDCVARATRGLKDGYPVLSQLDAISVCSGDYHQALRYNTIGAEPAQPLIGDGAALTLAQNGIYGGANNSLVQDSEDINGLGAECIDVWDKIATNFMNTQDCAGDPECEVAREALPKLRHILGTMSECAENPVDAAAATGGVFSGGDITGEKSTPQALVNTDDGKQRDAFTQEVLTTAEAVYNTLFQGMIARCSVFQQVSLDTANVGQLRQWKTLVNTGTNELAKFNSGWLFFDPKSYVSDNSDITLNSRIHWLRMTMATPQMLEAFFFMGLYNWTRSAGASQFRNVDGQDCANWFFLNDAAPFDVYLFDKIHELLEEGTTGSNLSQNYQMYISAYNYSMMTGYLHTARALRTVFDWLRTLPEAQHDVLIKRIGSLITKMDKEYKIAELAEDHKKFSAQLMDAYQNLFEGRGGMSFAALLGTSGQQGALGNYS